METRPSHPPRTELGTEELEAGMRPSRARDVVTIGLIAVTMLALFNSAALVSWTQQLPSTATNAWLAERAGAWHSLMQRLGTAQLFARVKERLDPETSRW